MIVSSHDWQHGEAHFRARVVALLKAKEDHQHTVDVPAPRDHELVERAAHHVARGGELAFVDIDSESANDAPAGQLVDQVAEIPPPAAARPLERFLAWLKSWF
jgi:hypothetical protein